jgi:addiction module HigA family antidote
MTAKKKLEPIHPGEILMEDFMKPMGLSINRLSREIMVPPNRISDIVNGKRAISADTALRLGKAFGVSPEIWLGLQSDYELRLQRNGPWGKIEERIHALAGR